MMPKRIILATLVTFSAITSLEANESLILDPSICPNINEAEVQTLAKDGTIEVKGKRFTLLSNKESGSDYNEKLIGKKEALSDFLAQVRPNSLLLVTHFINSHQNPFKRDHLKSHCPYIISTENETNIAVIALAPVS